MCGILLYLSREKKICSNQFNQALNLLNHRGPDNTEIFYSKTRDITKIFRILNKRNESISSYFFLGHKRLSIFDLSDNGHQPFYNYEKNKFLIFNGSFYNFKDYARRRYEKSDGRVLFELLLKHSINAFNFVNGMWASIFGNLEKRLLFFSRDRYGKKPLYYYFSKNNLIVSSEPKSIFFILNCIKKLTGKRKVSIEGVSKYIFGKLTPFYDNENNFYEDVKSFPSNSNMVFNLDSFSLQKLNDVNWVEKDNIPNNFEDYNEEKLINEIKPQLQDSLRLRIGGDSKIGVMFSGGIDSGLLTSLMLNILDKDQINLYTSHNYTPGGQINNDLKFAKNFAKQLNLNLIEVVNEDHSEKNLLDNLLKLTYFSELPINYLMSSMITNQVTKKMAENKIKVMIDGTGGDEIMGGYPNTRSLVMANAMNRNWSSTLLYLKYWLEENQFPIVGSSRLIIEVMKVYIFNLNRHISMNPIILNSLDKFKNPKIIQSIKYLDQNFYFRNNLCTALERQLFEIFKYQLGFYLGTSDIFSMANSVENRSPYLDYRLIKYSSIPEKFNKKNGYNKYLLRKMFPKNYDKNFVYRKKKEGIGINFKKTILNDNTSFDFIADSSFNRELMNIEYIKNDFNQKQIFTKFLTAFAALDHNYGITL